MEKTHGYVLYIFIAMYVYSYKSPIPMMIYYPWLDKPDKPSLYVFHRCNGIDLLEWSDLVSLHEHRLSAQASRSIPAVLVTKSWWCCWCCWCWWWWWWYKAPMLCLLLYKPSNYSYHHRLLGLWTLRSLQLTMVRPFALAAGTSLIDFEMGKKYSRGHIVYIYIYSVYIYI